MPITNNVHVLIFLGCIVHATGAVFLSLNDDIICNHTYVNLSLMMYPGNDDTNDTSSTVICHTDLDTCCNRQSGDDQGGWYFPDGTVLPGADCSNTNHVPIAQRRRNRVVRLQRGPTGSLSDIPSGIYRCDIETVAVNSADNTARETVYVGVYGSGGTLHYYTRIRIAIIIHN